MKISGYSNKNTNACELNGILKCWRSSSNLFGKNNERLIRQYNTATGKSKTGSNTCSVVPLNTLIQYFILFYLHTKQPRQIFNFCF